jgi:TolB protein
MTTQTISRRSLVLASASALAFGWTPAAHAQLNLRIGSGAQFQPMPIAVADFAGDGNLGPQVSGIVTNNLKRSGYFAPLDKGRHPERQPAFDAAPQFDAWKAAGVQGLITGRVTRDPSGRLKTEFRLWDIFAGQQITGHQYFTEPNNWRRIGHIISDAVYTKITGFGPFFDTRVVFVDESGPRENRRKRLRSWTRTAPMCAT